MPLLDLVTDTLETIFTSHQSETATDHLRLHQSATMSRVTRCCLLLTTAAVLLAAVQGSPVTVTPLGPSPSPPPPAPPGAPSATCPHARSFPAPVDGYTLTHVRNCNFKSCGHMDMSCRQAPRLLVHPIRLLPEHCLVQGRTCYPSEQPHRHINLRKRSRNLHLRHAVLWLAFAGPPPSPALPPGVDL